MLLYTYIYMYNIYYLLLSLVRSIFSIYSQHDHVFSWSSISYNPYLLIYTSSHIIDVTSMQAMVHHFALFLVPSWARKSPNAPKSAPPRYSSTGKTCGMNDMNNGTLKGYQRNITNNMVPLVAGNPGWAFSANSFEHGQHMQFWTMGFNWWFCHVQTQ